MHSHVLQVMIDPLTRQAYAVKFERKGKIYIIHATKEIVLSAGSVNTPQLLMLSGIGPAEHLKDLNIPVIADLRVGDNLQDHIAAGGLVFTLEQPVSMVQSRFENLPSILRYAMFDSGPLTVPGGVEGLAWVNTKYANSSDDWPDIEFHFVSALTPTPALMEELRFVESMVSQIWFGINTSCPSPIMTHGTLFPCC